MAKETSDLLKDYSTTEVSMDQRQSLFKTSLVWVISLSAFLVGGIIGDGTIAYTGLSAVLLGNIVLVSIASLISLIGHRTGLTIYMISRIVFGRKSSVVTSLLIGILAIGFIGLFWNKIYETVNSH